MHRDLSTKHTKLKFPKLILEISHIFTDFNHGVCFNTERGKGADFREFSLCQKSNRY